MKPNNLLKPILTILLVLAVVAGFIFFAKSKSDLVQENNTQESSVSETHSDTEHSVFISERDLIANLVSDPNFIPDGISNPTLTLFIKKPDNTLYRKIEIPFANSGFVVYGSDGRNVYIGGVKPDIQNNILAVNIDTGNVEQFYFGSIEPKGYVDGINFSENGRYMAYIDTLSSGGSTVYVHDFIYGDTLEIARFPEYAQYAWEGDNLTYYRGTEKVTLDVYAFEDMFEKKNKDFPYNMGGNEKYAIWSSVQFGEPGPAKLKIVNKFNGELLTKLTMPFKYGVTGLPLFVNDDPNIPTLALSEGTSVTRSLSVFNYKTGVLLDENICHQSNIVVLIKNDIFYTDCTPSLEPEVEETFQEGGQSNLLQKNLLTKKVTILRKAGKLENYNIESFSPASKSSSGKNELNVIKDTYKFLTKKEAEATGNLYNRTSTTQSKETILF